MNKTATLHWEILKTFPDEWTHHEKLPGEWDDGIERAHALAELEVSGYVAYRAQNDGEWRRTAAGSYVIRLRAERDLYRTAYTNLRGMLDNILFNVPQNYAAYTSERVCDGIRSSLAIAASLFK